MARIKFMIRSKNNPARIYERIKIGREIDLSIPTDYYIDIENWNPTKCRPKRISDKLLSDLDDNLNIQYEKTLRIINDLKSKNELSAEAIKNRLNPKSEEAALTFNKGLLTGYFDFYIDKLNNHVQNESIQKTTLTKYKVIKGIIVDMEKHYKTQYKVKDVNIEFITKFDYFCKSIKGYMPNTAGRAIKFVKTVCRDARINGIETHIQLDSIKGYTKKTDFIILDKNEIEQIERHEFTNPTLDNARDWLLISCYTGQRVSDFLRFKDNMLVEVENPNGGKATMIEFVQKKTNKEMKLPLHSKILRILEKRMGKFPNQISDQRYNEYIKLACREVGLNKKIKISKVDLSTNRKTYGEYEKWELITSHIGRRSFASNNYGKIPTPSIMFATGHTTEKMLLNYIGKTNDDKAFELLVYMEL